MKATTMTVKGGNTEIYQVDGRKQMAESLREQHPDVTKVTRKWHRVQHQVNYKPFKRNKLILKPGVVILEGTDEFGMELKVKPLLVGEACKGNGKPFHGKSGRFLAKLVELPLEAFLEAVETVNLLKVWPGKEGKGDAFPMMEAAEAAARLNVKGKQVLAAGKRVARAFGVEKPVYLTKVPVNGGTLWIVPHPSGINAWWNDEGNKRKARRFLKGLFE
jgi:uracil-DNA glycosylase